MSAKKLPPRAARRAQGRADAKLAESREKLARLEAGGAPRNPIEVESASQIDGHATSLRCARCDGPYRLEEHAAEVIEGARLRVVRVLCAACGARRVLYFRILSALPN